MEAIRELVGKLTGKEKAWAETAEGKLKAALEAAAKQAGENETAVQEDGGVRLSAKEAQSAYAGKSLTEDGSIYSYDFLTSLPDMKVTVLPEISDLFDADGKISTSAVVSSGIKNARSVGTEWDGKVYVRNSYTGKELLVRPGAIRHGLNGNMSRLLTNSRLGAVIGDVIKNAVPINSLHNKAQRVAGTYAMAAYATDGMGREFVAIVTVEQKSNNIAGIEAYDVTHAVSGRQKKGSQASTKLQGISPIKATKVSISNFLNIVKSTHQSILPEDVLAHFGEIRNQNGDYSDKVLFSLKDIEESGKTEGASISNDDPLVREIHRLFGKGEETEEAGDRPYRSEDPFIQAILDVDRGTRFAREEGTDSGLVYDGYVRTTLPTKTADRINAVAKALGVRVRFVDRVENGEANASISGTEILVEKDNKNPVLFVLGHEWTHRVQELAPGEYRVFREAIGEELSAKAEEIQSLYGQYGRSIPYEQAMDEAAANYAGRMLEDGRLLDEFIERHRTDRNLLERFMEAIRELVGKLTGKEKARAETAEGKLRAALEAAAKQAGENETAVQGDGGVRYSINEDFGGNILTWYRSGQSAEERFILGSTGPVLQGLGAIESDIFMESDKISKILKDHPEMTIREIQHIPDILEDPVLVLKSKGSNTMGQNSRLVIFGSVKAQDGRPIMCVLDLRPDEDGFLLDDMQKVSSTYTKDSNPRKFISSSEVLYADKKRTIRALRSAGFTNPVSLTLTRSGSLGSIAYKERKVNISGVPFSSVVSFD